MRTDTYDPELLIAMLKSAVQGKRIAYEGMREILDSGHEYDADDPEDLCEGLLDDARLLEKAIAVLERQTPPASAQSVEPVAVRWEYLGGVGEWEITHNPDQWQRMGFKVRSLGVITTPPSAEGAPIKNALQEACGATDEQWEDFKKWLAAGKSDKGGTV